MDILGKVKRNVPQVDLSQYFWVLSGQPKAGKTTLFRNLVLEHFGDVDKGLLAAFETGYTALDKINAVDINSWEDWENLVDELVENKDDIPYRFIGIDTVDVMYRMAVDKVLDEWNTKHPTKRAADIGGVGAKGNSEQGFGVGNDFVKEKLRKTTDRLRKAGFGIMAISHSKDRTVKQKDGNEFDQLQLSLSTTAREVFVNNADFIVFITSEKDKNSKTGEVTTTRYMYFRTDGYVEAGSRFTDVPDRIEFSVEGMLDVFKKAVLSSLGTGVDVQKVAEEQKATNEANAKKFISEEKAKKVTPEQLIEAIGEKVNKLTKTQKASLLEQLKAEFPTPNYKTFTDIDDLNKVIAMINGIVG